MPSLMEHHLRVAAVAQMICESLSTPVDKDGVVLTSLFHDMGNIIKFDLNYFPEFLQPEGLEYWQKVKDEYVEKYGNSEHIATEKIFKELNLPEVVSKYFEYIGFLQLERASARESIEGKICAYADQRVGPYGILSIKERLIDGSKRYQGREDKKMSFEQFENLSKSLYETEKQIFSLSFMAPDAINDEIIQKYVLDLKNFEI